MSVRSLRDSPGTPWAPSMGPDPDAVLGHPAVNILPVSLAHQLRCCSHEISYANATKMQSAEQGTNPLTPGGAAPAAPSPRSSLQGGGHPGAARWGWGQQQSPELQPPAAPGPPRAGEAPPGAPGSQPSGRGVLKEWRSRREMRSGLRGQGCGGGRGELVPFSPRWQQDPALLSPSLSLQLAGTAGDGGVDFAQP